MRARSLATLTLLLATVAFTGCDSNDGDDEATLQGTVLNADTSAPIADAFVRVTGGGESFNTRTDSDGAYSFVYTFEDVPSQQTQGDFSTTLNIEAFADGFQEGTESASVAVEVFGGATRQVQPLRLLPVGSAGSGGGGGEPDEASGPARSITLLSRDAEAITVAGAGGTGEIAALTFVVYDAQGRPVNGDQAVDVSFALAQPQTPPAAPEAATLSADRVRTDADGLARVWVTSGTQAQTVQVRASFGLPGVAAPFVSEPVTIVVHGGLPDQGFFAIVGDTLSVSSSPKSDGAVVAYVGDQFGNPVVEGTQVYFTATRGIVEGAAATDAMGRVEVSYVIPEGADEGSEAVIRASTAGRGGQLITDTILVVFE